MKTNGNGNGKSNGRSTRFKDKSAVIFDLFGTLVNIPTKTEYMKLCKEMAKVLRVPFNDFMAFWDPDRSARMTGHLSVESNLRKIVQTHLGQRRSDKVFAKAMKLYFKYHTKWMVPKVDAEKTVKMIKKRGYQLALMSNCSTAVSALWPKQALAKYFDATVLSCQVGLAKPDPKIYALVCKKLKVKPHQCVYVGDGGDGELTAASECGMAAVRVEHHTEDGLMFHRDTKEVPILAMLSHLPDMMG